jgi:hypothetical protein
MAAHPATYAPIAPVASIAKGAVPAGLAQQVQKGKVVRIVQAIRIHRPIVHHMLRQPKLKQRATIILWNR